ncbi:hypothetical protein GCM10025868_36990 [Angustibacter aerolatus]|uniref:histidine kinase n=1 Tax=Angustibacter aerolatus TaxID=1162965 RepID=A0ABQ6JM87_9ACTN|nr:hypothetical protein GCM10025868_36990 [Angustibacter aerolatus]
MAEMDVRRVERILRNLVVNALEHGNGLPIEIRTGSDVTSVAVTVRDHGVGLRPGESALVFNRFWRGDPSRARTMGGTGLGLAIASEDARMHGGWLQAWGEPGKGACFRLTLPRAPGHELIRLTPAARPDRPRRRPRRRWPVPAAHRAPALAGGGQGCSRPGDVRSGGVRPGRRGRARHRAGERTGAARPRRRDRPTRRRRGRRGGR